jgi:hypothetical protein
MPTGRCNGGLPIAGKKLATDSIMKVIAGKAMLIKLSPISDFVGRTPRAKQFLQHTAT